MSSPKRHLTRSTSLSTDTVAIASSSTTSTAIFLGGMNLVGISMPSAFTGTVLTVYGSTDGSTYKQVYNSSGTAFSLTVAADRWIALDPADLAGIDNIKFVSGSTEAAARTLTLILRDL